GRQGGIAFRWRQSERVERNRQVRIRPLADNRIGPLERKVERIGQCVAKELAVDQKGGIDEMLRAGGGTCFVERLLQRARQPLRTALFHQGYFGGGQVWHIRFFKRLSLDIGEVFLKRQRAVDDRIGETAQHGLQKHIPRLAPRNGARMSKTVLADDL